MRQKLLRLPAAHKQPEGRLEQQLPQCKDCKYLENGRRFSPAIPECQDYHRFRSDEKKTEYWRGDPHDEVSGAKIVSSKALWIVLDSAEGGNSDAASRCAELAHGQHEQIVSPRIESER